MRGRFASIAAASAGLVLIILLFYSAPTTWKTTLWGTPKAPVFGHAPYTGSPDPLPWNPPSPKDAPPGDGTAPDRLIIKVKLENEDVSWLRKLEPTWRNEIIDIKSMYSHAHPKAHRPDKGRIANAYLTWIIENYNKLPEIIIFLPPKDSFEQEPFDLRNAIPRIQTPFIQSIGFANLRCPTQKSLTTCNNRVLIPESPPSELRTLEAKMPNVWREWFGQDSEVPERIAAVLGAEFAVSREQVLKMGVERYLKIYTWLNKTIMDDDSAGLVCEWLWHVLFGRGPVECPERQRCECELYGNCEN